MKKIILLLSFLSLIISGNCKANPIVVEPVTSELYFQNNNWKLELYFDANLYLPYYTGYSDSLALITSTDTMFFKHGFFIPTGVPVIITNDSLLNPIQINKNGDIVIIAYKYYGTFIDLDLGYSNFIFGNYPGSNVTAPLPGQSIKRINYCDIIAKDNNPTIGYDQFNATATSQFYGYVYDSNNNSFSGIIVYDNGYCGSITNTDASGYFIMQGVYSCRHHIYPYAKFCINPDTILFIEPDSSTYMEFTFDSCYVGLNELSKPGDYSLKVFPNPGSGNFTFQITAPGLSRESCFIRIYNATGELVNIIPVGKANNSNATVSWNGKGKYAALPPGVYTCSLETNKQIVASQKLIIEK